MGFNLTHLIVFAIAYILGCAFGYFISIFKNGDITEYGYEKFRDIMYEKIDHVILRTTKKNPKEVVDEVVDKIFCAVSNGNKVLPTSDKQFWTKARIRKIVRPIVIHLMKKNLQKMSMSDGQNDGMF